MYQIKLTGICLIMGYLSMCMLQNAPLFRVTSNEAVEAVVYDVREETMITGDTCIEELKTIRLETLKEKNEDVAGWIHIPDTKLSYPLMSGTEGNYYLTHNWEKIESFAGSICIENLCSDDLTDFNTVIYGHRMKDGSMFAALKYYDSMDFWESHPDVYICDTNGVHRYEIFAAYEADLTGRTYQIGFADEEDKESFLQDCMGNSVISTGVIPTPEDRILTLSTCTGHGYDTRWVVQARKIVKVPSFTRKTIDT